MRSRFILRGEYEYELQQIWDKQATYHKTLTPERYQKIKEIIFFRRPLRPQKHLVGRCTYEPTKKRAPLSSPIFEAYRIEKFIHDLQYKGAPLTEEERAEARKICYQTKEISVSRFAKEMGKEPHRWNHDHLIPLSKPKSKKDDKTLEQLLGERYKNKKVKQAIWMELAKLLDDDEARAQTLKTKHLPEKSLEEIKQEIAPITFYQDNKFKIGAHTTLSINKILHKNNTLPKPEGVLKIEKIWHIIYYKLPASSKDKMVEQLKELGCTEEQIESLFKIKLKEGYRSLSRKVLWNSYLFMLQGYSTTEARVLAGVQNVWGERWNKLSQEKKEEIIQDAIQCFSKEGTIHTTLKSVLKEKYNQPENRLKKLYTHGFEKPLHQERPTLNTIQDLFSDEKIKHLRSPIVEQSLYALRKVIFAIYKKHGLPDEIHMELGRDLKGGKQMRADIRAKQKENERERDEIVAQNGARRYRKRSAPISIDERARIPMHLLREKNLQKQI